MQTIKRALQGVKGWIEMETQVVPSAELAQWAPGNRVPARIWPRETEGKAEGGSVILGTQKEGLGGKRPRRERGSGSRSGEDEHQAAAQELKVRRDAVGSALLLDALNTLFLLG